MARDIVSNSRYRGLADAVIGQTPIEVCCSRPIAIPLGCQGVRSCLTPPCHVSTRVKQPPLVRAVWQELFCKAIFKAH